MPQASSDYNEKIESNQQVSSIVHNPWELTDYYAQAISSDSKSSKGTGEPGDEASNERSGQKSSSSHGETILSGGGHIMSFIGGQGGIEGIDISLDKEARHLRKTLFQNRTRFDTIVEDLKMFDAGSLKNWLLLGNLVTIMVSDVILLLLSTQENLRISLGLIEALMSYSSLFARTQRVGDYDQLPLDFQTILDTQQQQIQYQWAQIFG